MQDPASELRRLGAFLGVEGLEELGATLPVVNAGHTKRGQNALGRCLARRHIGRQLATSPRVPWRVREGVKTLGRLGAAPRTPEPLDDDTEHQLVEKLSPDVRRLEAMLDQPITVWPRFSAGMGTETPGVAASAAHAGVDETACLPDASLRSAAA